MLEAKDVNFAYMRGQPVIKDMDCKIEDGELWRCWDINGSGKTTLSRLFMALCHPRSGQVLLTARISLSVSRQIWPIKSVTYSKTRTCRFRGYCI